MKDERPGHTPSDRQIGTFSGLRIVLTIVRQHPWLTLLAVVSTVVLSVHLTLEWRAQNAWDRYVAEAQQRGVKLWVQDFVRPAIPDAENFAALPMFQGTLPGSRLVNPFDLPSDKARVPNFASPVQPEQIDWVAWQTYFKKIGWLADPLSEPPRDVLRALSHLEPAIAQWREWKVRPQSRFPYDFAYELYPDRPQVAILTRAGRVFRLRLLAHLALRDSGAAWEDFEDLRQVYRALRDEPDWTMGLTRTANLSALCLATGEGLRNRVWSTTELRQLAEAMEEFHLADDLRLAAASGRAFENHVYETLLAKPMVQRGNMVDQYFFYSSSPKIGSTTLTVTALLPRWFFRGNQEHMNRYYDDLLRVLDTGSIELDGRRPVPTGPVPETGIDEWRFALFRQPKTLYANVIKGYWDLQALLQQTRQAIALERAYLARGAFPESAAELVPEFLPSVPIDNYSGLPLIYRRIGERSFSLYSVGSDLRDDGGQISLKVPADRQANRQADIVWPYAPPP